MIMLVVVVIAITGGAALGVACSALYVSSGRSAGWLVVQHRGPSGTLLPPSRPIGAETVAGGVESRSRAARPVGVCLDAAPSVRTIEARPGAGHPQITSSADEKFGSPNIHGQVQR
jgi:hypothetical protein